LEWVFHELLQIQRASFQAAICNKVDKLNVDNNRLAIIADHSNSNNKNKLIIILISILFFP